MGTFWMTGEQGITCFCIPYEKTLSRVVAADLKMCFLDGSTSDDQRIARAHWTFAIVVAHLRSCLLFELKAKVQAASACLQTLRLLCSANKRLHNTNALYSGLPDIRVTIEHLSISKTTTQYTHQ
jgi:hypothetical protein